MPQEIKIMSDEIGVQQGFPNELRSSAAELYDAAFPTRTTARKLSTTSLD
jgi:vacuolar-type H+-ATPase catalytic subunit A/Vma1